MSSLMALAQEKNSRPSSYNYRRGVEAIQNDNAEEALEYLNKEIEENPKNGYAFFWIALARLQREEYGRMLTSADLSIKYLPKKDTEYRYLAYSTRARVYSELEDTVKALDDYASAIMIMPDNEDAYEKRAQIYYEQKKYDLADADYRKIISLDQGGVVGYMGIGRNKNARKLWDEAIVQFDHVTKLYSDYSSAFAFRAESYLGKQDWDKATDDIVKALDIDENAKAFYLMQGLDDAAFASLKAKFQIKSSKEPNSDRWLYYLGIIHEQRAMYPQAIKFYEEANKRNLSVRTLEQLAYCYGDNGQYELKLAAIEKALDMEPGKQVLLCMRADALYDVGKINEAILEWDSILAMFPDNVSGYYRRGWFKKAIDDIDGAIEDFTLALVLDPEDVHSYISRANMYEKQGKKELARADYEKVIELEATPDDYQVSMYAYQALGDNEKAIEVMDTLIARDTAKARVYYEAACLYSKMNRQDEALNHLETCLAKGYRRFAHIAGDHDMDNIRESPRFVELIETYKSKADSENPVKYEGNKDPRNVSVYEVPYTKDGSSNLCNVKCTINDLPLYFIFDTGASDVSLSQVEATFMMKNGYINKTDVVGNAYFSDAVGNVNVGTIINLRSVDFGGLRLTNVKASVTQNQKAPLLLGQSVLGRLGKIEIDNANRVLRITNK